MSRRRVREELQPDITPLIDILFILVIFFIVTSVFRKDEVALMLSLPTSEAKPLQETSDKDMRLVIELDKEQFAVNGAVMEMEGFPEILAKFKDPNTPVEVRIDKGVTYDRVVKVLDTLQKFNLTNLNLITKK